MKGSCGEDKKLVANFFTFYRYYTILLLKHIIEIQDNNILYLTRVTLNRIGIM